MPGSLKHAANILRQGGVIACATEYCFGLSCDPRNERAVRKLLRIKNRSADKGLILLAAYMDQLTPYVVTIPEQVAATWPGPYTWLVEPRPFIPYWITGDHPRVAVRVTAHAQAAALCRTAQMAIISTSANRAGEAPARSYRETMRRLGNEVDYVLPGRVGNSAAPTTIRDALTRETIRC